VRRSSLQSSHGKTTLVPSRACLFPAHDDTHGLLTRSLSLQLLLLPLLLHLEALETCHGLDTLLRPLDVPVTSRRAKTHELPHTIISTQPPPLLIPTHDLSGGAAVAAHLRRHVEQDPSGQSPECHQFALEIKRDRRKAPALSCFGATRHSIRAASLEETAYCGC